MKVLPATLALLLTLAGCQPVPGPTTGQTAKPSPTASATPVQPVPTPTPDFKVGNLIPNPGAEIAQGSKPANWNTDSFGDQQSEFTWREDSPYDGQHYLAIQNSHYGSEGDAKWYFDLQRLRGGWYQYSDVHRSDGRSRMLYSCQPPGGSRRYYNAWQSHTSPGWKEESFRFYLPTDCDVTVIHSLDRNGFLHTDHQQLRAVDAKPFKQPMVSITFDDIWKTAYTLGASELEKRGFKGSFYVTHLYAETPADLYASTGDIRDLVNRGHEVGSHAHRHNNLSQLAEPDLLEDLRKEMVYLKDLGVTNSGIAYPFGDFDDKVETEVQRYHAYARTSLEGLNDAGGNRYRLRIISVTSDLSTEDLLKWVEAARATNTWLIFLFHDLGEPLVQHPYRTPLDQYLKVLDALKEKNVKVVTTAEGLKESGL